MVNIIFVLHAISPLKFSQEIEDDNLAIASIWMNDSIVPNWTSSIRTREQDERPESSEPSNSDHRTVGKHKGFRVWGGAYNSRCCSPMRSLFQQLLLLSIARSSPLSSSVVCQHGTPSSPSPVCFSPSIFLLARKLYSLLPEGGSKFEYVVVEIVGSFMNYRL